MDHPPRLVGDRALARVAYGDLPYAGYQMIRLIAIRRVSVNLGHVGDLTPTDGEFNNAGTGLLSCWDLADRPEGLSLLFLG